MGWGIGGGDGEAFCSAPESLPGFNGKYVMKGPDGRMEISLRGSGAKGLPFPASSVSFRLEAFRIRC